MFSLVRTTALAAVAAGLALSSPARADWLVTYDEPVVPLQVEFDTPTFETSASTNGPFSLNVGAVSGFAYNLTVDGFCSIGGNSISFGGFGCHARREGSPTASLTTSRPRRAIPTFIVWASVEPSRLPIWRCRNRHR